MIYDEKILHDGCRAVRTYRVADHTFVVRIPSAALAATENMMAAYRPFETEEDSAPLFRLDVCIDKNVTIPEDFAEETRQTEDGQTIVSGNLGDDRKGIVYLWNDLKAFVECSGDYRTATLHTTPSRMQNAIDNTLMLLFAFTTAQLQTLLFHSSTVVWQGRGYMFLGVSGTGKSTHSRLWLKNIPGTHLLNDDNPVVRINEEGTSIVYGSPWSGKTPCYKNEQYPVGTIVKLHQAPKNEIRQASILDAYVAVVESVSGKRWEKSIADGMHATAEAILKGCKVFLLDCLPDDDAAAVCWGMVADKACCDSAAAKNEGGKG